MHSKFRILFISLVSLLSVSGIIYGISYFSDDEDAPPIQDDPMHNTTLLETPTSGLPSDYSAEKNVYYTAYKLNKEKYYVVSTTGSCVAKVAMINYEQKINNIKYINDTEAFSEAISTSSLKKIAVQRYITPNDFLFRDTSKVSNGIPQYNDNIVNLSKDKYLELYGNTPFGITNYILNEHTIINARITNDGENYILKFDVEPSLGGMKYQREVATMAGADNLPTFEAISVAMKINSAWQVLQIDATEKYKLPIMGGLNCTVKITDNFSYSQTALDIPERSVFAPYFGTDSGTIEDKKKTGLDYLTDAFNPYISAGKKLLLQLSISDISVVAEVDLTSKNFNIEINKEVLLKYSNQNLYFILGEVELLVKKEEIEGLMDFYFSGTDLAEIDFSKLLESDLILGLLETMEEEITDDFAIINLSYKKIQAMIKIAINDNIGSLSSMDILIDNNNVNICLLNEYDFISESANPTEVVNLVGYVESIKQLITNKKISIDCSLFVNIDNVPLNFKLNLSVDYTSGLIITGTLLIKYNTEEYLIKVIVLENVIYLSYSDDLNVKLQFNEIDDLIKKISYLFGNFLNIENLDSLTKKLAEFDFSTLVNMFKSFEMNENSAELLLDLGSFELGKVILNYDLEKGLSITGNSAKVLISKGIEINPVIPENYFIEYEELTAYLNGISSLLATNKYSVDFESTIKQTNNELLRFQGNLLIDISKGLDFELAINGFYNNLSFNIQVEKIDNLFYLHFTNLNIVLTYEELRTFLYEVFLEYNLDVSILDKLPEKLPSSLDISLEQIRSIQAKTIIDSLKFTQSGIYFSLDSSLLGLKFGEFMVSYLKDDFHNLRLSSPNTKICFARVEECNISPKPNEYLDKNDLDNILYCFNSLYQYLNEDEISLSFSGHIANNNYSGFLEIIKSGMNISYINLYLKYESTRVHEIYFQLLDNELFINYNNFKFRIKLTSIEDVIQNIVEVFDLDENILNLLNNGLTLVDFVNHLFAGSNQINLNDFISFITTYPDVIKIGLNLSSIFKKESVYVLNYFLDQDVINLSINSLFTEDDKMKFDLDLQQNKDKIMIKEVNLSEYFNFNSLSYLLNCFKKTADLHYFDMSGVISVYGININLKALVKINTDQTTSAHITMTIPYVPFVTKTKTVANIYYHNHSIYIKRELSVIGIDKGTYINTYSEKYFLENIVDILCLVVNFSDSITSSITSAVTDSNKDKEIIYENIIKDFSYQDYTLFIKISGESISNDPNINDFNINIDFENDLIKRIYGDFNFLGFLKLNLNAKLENIGNEFNIIFPEGFI